MPVGDLLTADYQIEVNGLLYADGGTYNLAEWPQFFTRLVKANGDIDLLGDGDYPGKVWRRARDIVWETELAHTTPATLQTRIETVLATWDGESTQLAFKIAGTKYRVDGQTRRIEVGDTTRPFGWVVLTQEFHMQPGLTVI